MEKQIVTLEWELEGLVDLIEKITGYRPKELTATNDQNGFLCIKSEDIVDQMGIMGIGLKTAFITNFGGGFFEDGNKAWITIEVKYEKKSLGWNGTELFTACYDYDTNEWSSI